jgi:hypothetical protein
VRIKARSVLVEVMALVSIRHQAKERKDRKLAPDIMEFPSLASRVAKHQWRGACRKEALKILFVGISLA